MARIDPDTPLLPSLLDRLLDDQPDSPTDPRRSRGQNLAELRQAIRRDLEAFLNTRQRCLSPPPGLPGLTDSLINYGIPDFTGISLASQDSRDDFRAAIEAVIRRFEPRFQRIAVTLVDGDETEGRALRFRIEALVYADPAPEPVVFSSWVDPATRMIAVSGG